MPRPPKRLATYRAKRHFDVTSEPPPDAPARKRTGGGLRFMIHKHDATRLHYDLRLEIDGALASWAVPKGPSFDPADRRLAVETEDHPLAYADFEGRIPEGEYGAGDSIIWDSGSFETVPPGQAARMREKGHIEFELKGKKLRGRWHLVRTRMAGGKQQWLLFKGRDEYADVARNIVAERPESVVSGRTATRGPARRAKKVASGDPIKLLLGVWPPMLATLADVDDLDPDRSWIYEVKYDGFRALAGISEGKLSLQSRKGNDLAARFPAIVKALGRLGLRDAVLDGEVIAVTHNAAGRFQDLQQSHPDQRFAVFDLLWLDGEDLRARPFSERRELLERALADAKSPIVLSEQLGTDLKKALREAHRRGSEGVLAKALDAPYQGTRSKDWLKLKLHETQEVVLVGYLPIKTGAKAIGALLAAVRDGEGFRYVGKIGTGFTMDLREELWKRMEKLRVDEPPVRDPPRFKDIRWVRPKLVAQVEFTEWTQDARMRHPSFQGLRDDKDPGEVVRERRTRKKRLPT